MKLTLELAKRINKLHGGLRSQAKTMIEDAVNIGELLIGARENNESGTFESWLEENVIFSKRAAYSYISLFNYKKQISAAENLTEAYKMIETLEAQKKQKETANAYKRVGEYKKTGIKPDGWRRGTDDKLAKEDIERDARIDAVKQEAVKRQEKKETRYEPELKADTDSLLNFFDQKANEQKKRSEFKEKIRLSFEGESDPFLDALMDYLDGLENDSRRIEVCHNIIKICKKITNDLQAVRA